MLDVDAKVSMMSREVDMRARMDLDCTNVLIPVLQHHTAAPGVVLACGIATSTRLDGQCVQRQPEDIDNLGIARRADEPQYSCIYMLIGNGPALPAHRATLLASSQRTQWELCAFEIQAHAAGNTYRHSLAIPIRAGSLETRATACYHSSPAETTPRPHRLRSLSMCLGLCFARFSVKQSSISI